MRRVRRQQLGWMAMSAVIVGCAAKATPATPPMVVAPAHSTAEHAESRRTRFSRTAPLCTVEFTPRTAEDANDSVRALARVQAAFRELWGASPIEQVFRHRIECRVHIGSTSNCLMGPGHAFTSSAMSKGEGVADVYLFALSAYPDGFKTSAGLPVGTWFTEKILLHELAGIVVDTRRSERAGWDMGSTPPWFRQGLEELISIRSLSDRKVAQATWAAYLAASLGGGVSFGASGVTAKNPYVDGTTLVGFLWARAGRDKFFALLDDESPTFDDAMRTRGMTAALNQADWSAWAASGPALPH